MKRAFCLLTMIVVLAIGVCPPVFADVTVDLADGVVAYWPFDEGGGDTAADVIGGHTGALGGVDGGPTWTDDAFSGMALDFTPPSLVTVQDAPDLNDWSAGFTLAQWLRPRGGGAIIDKSSGDAADQRLQWYILGGGNLHWGGGSIVVVDDPIPLDEWYHVAWTHDGATTLVYVDGEVIGTADYDGPIPDTTGHPLYFGNRLYEQEGRGEWFNGIQDEVGLWARALSGAEIGALADGALVTDTTAVELEGKLTTTWAWMKAHE